MRKTNIGDENVSTEETLIKLVAELVEVNKNALRQRVDTSVSVDNNNFRVVKDLDKTVKSFNGREKQQEARDWLDMIIGLANLNGWSDVFKLQFVRSNVVGAGRNWFLLGNFKSWNELVEDFELTFTQFDSKADIMDTMYFVFFLFSYFVVLLLMFNFEFQPTTLYNHNYVNVRGRTSLRMVEC